MSIPIILALIPGARGSDSVSYRSPMSSSGSVHLPSTYLLSSSCGHKKLQSLGLENSKVTKTLKHISNRISPRGQARRTWLELAPGSTFSCLPKSHTSAGGPPARSPSSRSMRSGNPRTLGEDRTRALEARSRTGYWRSTVLGVGFSCATPTIQRTLSSLTVDHSNKMSLTGVESTLHGPEAEC